MGWKVLEEVRQGGTGVVLGLLLAGGGGKWWALLQV